jgi:hypothetical protein
MDESKASRLFTFDLLAECTAKVDERKMAEAEAELGRLLDEAARHTLEQIPKMVNEGKSIVCGKTLFDKKYARRFTEINQLSATLLPIRPQNKYYYTGIMERLEQRLPPGLQSPDSERFGGKGLSVSLHHDGSSDDSESNRIEYEFNWTGPYTATKKKRKEQAEKKRKEEQHQDAAKRAKVEDVGGVGGGVRVKSE